MTGAMGSLRPANWELRTVVQWNPSSAAIENLIVLVGVLFAQVLGLAVQVKRTTERNPPA